ncbi:MAG TPA: cellulase family glycosylhydrolase [Gaiellaceae bacterium]|nr:cellulase family glycosylhydrolase [Gaiellaceae bacterium]
MGVAARNLAVVGAIASLAAVTSSAGAANARHATHATPAVRTYRTHGTAPLATAVVDPALFNSSEREKAFALARSASATYVRIAVSWSAIAPSTRPDRFVATDPTSPGYNWDGLDTVVRQAEAAGVTPILDVSDTPSWAFAKRPQGVDAGTPKASALGDFAQALATHFNGTGGLPAEHLFEVWNEVNNSLFLGPSISASSYRGMVNALAAGVHAVDPKNLVVAGDLDPFGHPKSHKQKWYSVAPLAFMRSLLCLSKGSHPHATCHSAAHFDVWAHHPYTFGGPFGHAKNPDNVELGDLPRMRAVLQAGTRLHHVVSAHRVQFWATEFGWDTNPPRKHAASLGLAARWTAESMYQAWRSGVTLFTWFDLQDRSSPSPYQSGLYFHSKSLESARAKPVRTAFRFPFVAYLHKTTVSVWGRDATSDKERVTIQFRHGKSGRWSTVAYNLANSRGIFKATLKLKATTKDWLRASATGSGNSLAFSLTVPNEPHIGPWGK